MSVSNGPGTCFRHWCSSRSLRISPLHREFQYPLPHSRRPVSADPSQLSREISQVTYHAAYAPFTPNNSEQRLPPTYYRGCWHVVSRGLFILYRQTLAGIRPEQKKFTIRRPSSFTQRCWIRVSPIVQNSPLLPSVEVGPVSQCPRGRSPFQAGYPSSPWWAITSPTS